MKDRHGLGKSSQLDCFDGGTESKFIYQSTSIHRTVLILISKKFHERFSNKNKTMCKRENLLMILTRLI